MCNSLLPSTVVHANRVVFEHGRFRLDPEGNRQVDHALDMIAVIQFRGIGPGKSYVATPIAAAPQEPELSVISDLGDTRIGRD